MITVERWGKSPECSICLAGVKIGTIRFSVRLDKNRRKVATLTISLFPEFRNKGHGIDALIQFVITIGFPVMSHDRATRDKLLASETAPDGRRLWASRRLRERAAAAGLRVEDDCLEPIPAPAGAV